MKFFGRIIFYQEVNDLKILEFNKFNVNFINPTYKKNVALKLNFSADPNTAKYFGHTKSNKNSIYLPFTYVCRMTFEDQKRAGEKKISVKK